MLNLWYNVKQAKTELIVFTPLWKVENFLLYVPTQNIFRRIWFRINNASVQLFFSIFYYCYCCDFIIVLNLLIRLVQDLKHGCAFGWEACFLLRGVLSALAASRCYNQNLNLYTCNMLDFVTELCFATILMKIYIYIFLSCLGSHWYAKSWLYWHVG